MNQRRKKSLVLVLLFYSIISYTYAQDTLSDLNSLKAGTWALQFGISSNFTLTSFQGSTVSFKYHLSNKNALRVGITINGTTNNGNSSSAYSVADTSYGSLPQNGSSYAANVSFSIQYLWYMNPSGPVHFYYGLGPSISYIYSHNSSDNYNFYNTTIYNDTSGYHHIGYWGRIVNTSNSSQWGIGLTGVVGLEWFACKWLSIRAEYSEGVQYIWRSNASSIDNSYNYPSIYLLYTSYHSPDIHNDNSGTSKGWSVSSAGVSFGLSVYW